MEGCSKNGENCSQLLNFIAKEREWLATRKNEERLSEKKLELRLGPPGGEDWSHKDTTTIAMNNRDRAEESLLSLGYKFSSSVEKHPQGGSSAAWFNQHQQQQANVAPPSPSFLQFPSTTAAAAGTAQNLPVMTKESSQTCCTKVTVGLQQACAEKKAFSPPAPANTAVPNSSQKRTAPGPVVGWPPIRSFRKNLASSSSSKQALATESENPNKKVAGEKPVDTCSKGLFVKINMDGVPIGRKVDLKAYDSYEKLSSAVDELFRGLLAAQRDSCGAAGGIKNKQEEEKAITGALDGSGEYTLVYEDNEGDRMLVGDVPWHMFVSTVKRLRVLKSSEVSALSLGSTKQDKIALK